MNSLKEEKILLVFRQLAGLEAQEALRWQALCASAGAHVGAMLREGANTPENAQRIHTLAAFIAYARYCEIQGIQEPGVVRVGDISVEATDYSGKARKMEEAVLGLFSDLLCVQGFVFMHTEV